MMELALGNLIQALVFKYEAFALTGDESMRIHAILQHHRQSPRHSQGRRIRQRGHNSKHWRRILKP